MESSEEGSAHQPCRDIVMLLKADDGKPDAGRLYQYAEQGFAGSAGIELPCSGNELGEPLGFFGAFQTGNMLVDVGRRGGKPSFSDKGMVDLCRLFPSLQLIQGKDLQHDEHRRGLAAGMYIRPAVHQGKDIFKMTSEIGTEHLLIMDLRKTAVGKGIGLPVFQEGHGLVVEPLLLETTGLPKDGDELLMWIAVFEQESFVSNGGIEITARPIERVCLTTARLRSACSMYPALRLCPS